MTSNDQESLLALQALLQIRANVQGDQNPATGVGMGGKERTSSADQSNRYFPNENPTAAQMSNLLRMGASPSSLLQQAQAAFGYSSAQVAAMRAAAASSVQNSHSRFTQSGLLQSALPSYSSGTRQSSGVQRPFLDAMSRDSSFAQSSPANSPPVLPRSPLMTPERTVPPDLRSPALQTPQDLSQSEQSTPAVTRKQDDGRDAESAEERRIRKDEVEAALRSKPQRGRKRENLNAEERLELTRTRNREHAKSTRVRKKQRYQELLDTEQKYLDSQREEDLNYKRRETVIKFLSAREKELNRVVETQGNGAPFNDEEEADEDAQKPETENRGSGSGTAGVGGSSTRVTPEKTDDDETDSNISPDALSLGDFVEDMNRFKFETSLRGVHAAKGADAMAKFHKTIARRLEDDASVSKLSYHVEGSTDGISINNYGDAFCKVDLAIGSLPSGAQIKAAGTQRVERKTLLYSLVSFHFRRDSYKISSVSWCVLKDNMRSASPNSRCGSENGSKSESTAKDSLESQTVYPSVVSLDPMLKLDNTTKNSAETKQDEDRDSAEKQEPHIDDTGMNI